MKILTFVPIALLGLLLGACLSPTEQFLLNLDFEGNISVDEDAGICTVGLTVLASGTGTAEWESIRYRSASGTIREYSGATVGDFFGAASINAGATQVSERVPIPLDAVDPSIEVNFSIRGRDRQVTVVPICVEPDEEGSAA